MTREEALSKLRAVVVLHDANISERSIEASLDSYVALGLIRLNEPKSAEEILQGYLNGGPKWMTLDDWLRMINIAGLQITKK